MKFIALSALILSTLAAAQTTQLSSTTQATQNTSAIIISPGPQQSATPDETEQLRKAVYAAKVAADNAAAAQAALSALQATIAQAHAIDTTKPYQVVIDSSWTITYVPPAPPTPVWVTVAASGQTVTVPAGTTIRYGNLAGTACSLGTGGCPLGNTLPTDVFTTVTVGQSTTFVVNPGSGPFATDPAYGFVKVLQVQQGTGTVTVQP